MNILFLHEVDWLKKIVFEIHDWSERLSKDHKVFAIDYEDSWKREGFFDFGTIKTIEFKPIDRAHKGAEVTLRRPGMIKLPVFDKLSAIFTHYYEIERLIKEEKIDIIVLYSVPTDGLQVLHLAKKYNIPVIFRSIDTLHQLVPNWVLSNITYFLEKVVYKNADRILTLTPKLSEYVVRMGADTSNVELLRTGVDTKKFNPDIDPVSFRKELGIAADDKVILFMGTLFEFSQLDQYIEHFPDILEGIPEAKLLIVGGGELLERLQKIVISKGLSDKVMLTGFQPYDMMPQYINIADVCINPFRINGITKDVMPIKVLQYLASGKPVIATPLPGLVSVIPGEQSGMVYSEDILGFVSTTIDLLKSRDKMIELGQNGRDHIKKYHDLDEISKYLEEIIIKLVKEKGGSVPCQ
jgi:glycosyltransferase involved in cell wall biosynthesis